MRRDTMLLGVWCVAVVTMAALLSACSPVEVTGVVTDRPDTATAGDMIEVQPADLSRSVDARVDSRIGIWCVQSLGDGGRDALSPGAPCSLNGIDRCAQPIECSFESFDYGAACLPGAAVDGGGDYRCCQFATTHSMVDGSIETCRNCGDGWTCTGS